MVLGVIERRLSAREIFHMPSRSTAAAQRTSRRTRTKNPHRSVMAEAPSQVPLVALGSSAGGLEALEAFFHAMPQILMAFARVPYLAAPTEKGARPDLTEEFLRQIRILLRNRTKHDFSGYKPTTLRSRLTRRIAGHQLDTPQQHLQMLQEDPYELDLLFRDFLIAVTSFFRDPEAFHWLSIHVLPQLLQKRPEHDPVRVWVAGCSTGEEAYSLAIVLHEYIERLGLDCPVQIFATDLDGQNIEKARTGIYPDGIARDVSPERLTRFFIHENGNHRIKPKIRNMVVFAQHNVIADPPFIKLDLPPVSHRSRRHHRTQACGERTPPSRSTVAAGAEARSAWHLGRWYCPRI